MRKIRWSENGRGWHTTKNYKLTDRELEEENAYRTSLTRNQIEADKKRRKQEYDLCMADGIIDDGQDDTRHDDITSVLEEVSDIYKDIPPGIQRVYKQTHQELFFLSLTRSLHHFMRILASKLTLNQAKKFNLALENIYEKEQADPDVCFNHELYSIQSDVTKSFLKHLTLYMQKTEEKFAPFLCKRIIPDTPFPITESTRISALNKRDLFSVLRSTVTLAIKRKIIHEYLGMTSFFKQLNRSRIQNKKKAASWVFKALVDLIKFYAYLPTAIILESMQADLKGEWPAFLEYRLEEKKKFISQLIHGVENQLIDTYSEYNNTLPKHQKICFYHTAPMPKESQKNEKALFDKYDLPAALLENPNKTKNFLLKLSKDTCKNMRKELHHSLKDFADFIVYQTTGGYHCDHENKGWDTEIRAALDKESYSKRLKKNMVDKQLCSQKDFNKGTHLFSTFFCFPCSSNSNSSNPMKRESSQTKIQF